MFGDIMKKESKSTKETGHSFEDYFKRAVNPVIYRLASHGFVREGPKAISEDNRVRQYYEITPEGTAYLHQIEEVYDQMVEAVQQIRHNSGDEKNV